MHPLSARDLLHIWERGENQHPIHRALTLLVFSCPEMTWAELAQLSIGQRNVLLMTLWELTFGSQLDGYAECPQCWERLEFSVNVPDLHRANGVEPPKSGLTLAAKGFDVNFRLANSLDLEEIANCTDTSTARHILVRSCLLKAHQGDKEIAPETLPEAVITELSNQMLRHDPWSEVRLDLLCPECGNRWASFLDIVSFLWAAISAEAKRLLYEIHLLARAYGWREVDILAMSARLRQLYLEMVT